MKDRNKLLLDIITLDFTATDLHLYLNTHPHDKRAINLYNNIVEKADELRMKYEKLFGPLCSFRSKSAECFTWIKEPWPWDDNISLNPINEWEDDCKCGYMKKN